MSLHRSLKTKPGALNQHRNVLSRAERITRLTEQGRFRWGEDSPLKLVKVASRKVVTKKKKAAKEETAEAVPGAPAATAAAPAAAGAKPAAAAKPAAKPGKGK
jgi:small basic protein (TIGR04137 family)